MLANKIEIWIKYDYNFACFVPGSFCSALAFWGPIIMVIAKPDGKFFQFAMFGMALGGLLTTFYPEFTIGTPTIFAPVNFTGLVYHTLMFVSFVYVIGIGYYKPSMQNWGSFPLGMLLMVPYILFNSQVLGASEDMYLFSPAIEGTSLYWWAIGLLAICIYTIFLLIYEQFAFEKQSRWLNTTYNKIRNYFSSKKKKSRKEINESLNETQPNNDLENTKSLNESDKNQ